MLRTQFAEKVREFRDLPKRFAKEHAALTQQAQALQLRQFLEQFDIAPASIKGIGPARKAALASFGIETAADCDRTMIYRVPGFGPSLASALIDWRDCCAVRFRFDPATGVPRADLDAMRIKQQQVERSMRDDRLHRAQTLLAFPNTITSVRTKLLRQAREAAVAAVRAGIRS